MGPRVELVECGPSVATSLVRLMEEGKLEGAGRGEDQTHRLLTTGSAEPFRRVASALWPEGLPKIEEVAVEVDHGAVRRQAP